MPRSPCIHLGVSLYPGAPVSMWEIQVEPRLLSLLVLGWLMPPGKFNQPQGEED